MNDTGTCYIHSQVSDAEEVAFVMRSERFVNKWIRHLRDAVGDDNVYQIRVAGGKAAWAIPWESAGKGLAVARMYFSEFVPERESVLGFAPFTEEQQIEVSSVLENLPIKGGQVAAAAHAASRPENDPQEIVHMTMMVSSARVQREEDPMNPYGGKDVYVIGLRTQTGKDTYINVAYSEFIELSALMSKMVKLTIVSEEP